jgi:hypothetical protein
MHVKHSAQPVTEAAHVMHSCDMRSAHCVSHELSHVWTLGHEALQSGPEFSGDDPDPDPEGCPDPDPDGYPDPDIIMSVIPCMMSSMDLFSNAQGIMQPWTLAWPALGDVGAGAAAGSILHPPEELVPVFVLAVPEPQHGTSAEMSLAQYQPAVLVMPSLYSFSGEVFGWHLQSHASVAEVCVAASVGASVAASVAACAQVGTTPLQRLVNRFAAQPQQLESLHMVLITLPLLLFKQLVEHAPVAGACVAASVAACVAASVAGAGAAAPSMTEPA